MLDVLIQSDSGINFREGIVSLKPFGLMQCGLSYFHSSEWQIRGSSSDSFLTRLINWFIWLGIFSSDFTLYLQLRFSWQQAGVNWKYILKDVAFALAYDSASKLWKVGHRLFHRLHIPFLIRSNITIFFAILCMFRMASRYAFNMSFVASALICSAV